MNFNKKASKIFAVCLIAMVICLAACNREGQSPEPTDVPTSAPTEQPTSAPTEAPTEQPTDAPTEQPTSAPTDEPTEAPTDEPTEAPTDEPTEAPTDEPTEAPTDEPTEAPTDEPTEAPTDEPTEAPTEPPCEHTYNNSCDTDCNKCGAQREITHDYSEEWITDTEEHWKQCKICGDKTALESHGFDNACDGDCNICGEMRIPAEHSYIELVHDADGHWNKCAECGNIANSQSHTYEKVHKDGEAHDLSCVACGYVSTTEAHVYIDDYCACGYKNPCEHSGGNATCKARAVCENCGYEYGELGGHSGETVSGYAATCTEDGMTDGEKCSLCGKTLTEQELIPASHTEQIIPATPPTCDEDGLTVGSKCSVCGDILSAQESVDALGHSYEQTNYTAPTCTEQGSATYTCDTCSDTKTEYTDALGHTESGWITQPEPTCDAAGQKYKTCLVCEDIIDSKNVPATGHSWDNGEVISPTCEEQGYTKYTCLTCTMVEKKDYTDATGHTSAIDEGKEATCTEEGITEGRHCHTCGEILEAQTVIDPLGHDEITHDAKAATCTESGYKAYVTCSRCDYTTYEATDALGHDAITHGAKAATCTEGGYKAYVTCSRCDYTTYEATDALGHNWTLQSDSSYKCTTNGGCGGIIEAPAKIASSFDSFYIGSTETLFSGYTGGSIGVAKVSGVDKSAGGLTIENIFAGTSLILWGWVGYDEAIESFGYYFDGNSEAVAAVSCITPEDAVITLGGQHAKRFRIMADTSSLSAGSHTLTYAVCFEDGAVVPLAVWNIDIKSKQADTDKPTANVIIVSGQSNAYGASPITDSVKAKYGNKTYNNVYIHYNNINVMGDSSADGGTWKTMFSNAEFEQYKLGIGAQSTTYLGPELGIIDYLTTNGYTDDAPLYVIKFTAAGTFLNGQWFPTNLPHYGSNLDPYGLVSDMGDYLYNQMVDYINDSIAMITNDYNVKIQGFFWVQGESDSGAPNLAVQYELYEQKLVSGIRTEFAEYTSDTGISFVNYAIAETPEGNITWPYAATINDCKENNCGYWYDPEATGDKVIENSMPNINNSYLVIADSLRSKATAGDYEGGAVSTDYAHMCGDDMATLGQWMGEGLLYLKSKTES